MLQGEIDHGASLQTAITARNHRVKVILDPAPAENISRPPVVRKAWGIQCMGVIRRMVVNTRRRRRQPMATTCPRMGILVVRTTIFREQQFSGNNNFQGTTIFSENSRAE